MLLTNSDMVDLVDWRHALHRRPEVSGEETETAAAVVEFIGASKPDRIMTGMGGHGVAAVFDGREPGPTVMFRCELDGLPIEELSDKAYRSAVPGKGHLCGHDGHMAILAALVAHYRAATAAMRTGRSAVSAGGGNRRRRGCRHRRSTV